MILQWGCLYVYSVYFTRLPKSSKNSSIFIFNIFYARKVNLVSTCGDQNYKMPVLFLINGERQKQNNRKANFRKYQFFKFFCNLSKTNNRKYFKYYHQLFILTFSL